MGNAGTYILVHGAWHGAWCWNRVRAILEKAGHLVIARSLPGMAEREDESSSVMGLEDHITAVMEWVEESFNGPLIIVGHSYAGMVITGVADRLPGKFSHLVYLDAYCPRPGNSLADIMGGGERWRERADRDGEGWRVPPPAKDNFGVSDPTEVKELRSLLTPQPLKTFLDPVHLNGDPGSWSNVTWIACEPHHRPPFAHWQYETMDTGHDAMLTEPEQLCEILGALAPVA